MKLEKMIQLVISSILFLAPMACVGTSQTSTESDTSPFTKINRLKTAYCIDSPVDLKGDTIFMPQNYSLIFGKKGKISNAVIVGNETNIKACKEQLIFKNCKFLGIWRQSEYYPQWFGAKPDGKTDCTDAIQTIVSLLHYSPYSTLYFSKGVYCLFNEVHFDTPLCIKGQNATITTTSDFEDRDAFRFSKSAKGQFRPNDAVTDICINFKTYSVPIGFYGYNNVNMHDCTVSTYSSTTHGYPHTKFWFAINCTRLYDAIFKNIHIDQPICYKKNVFNSADGLHLMGQCHDIKIDNLYGFAGDDFIALNASEMSWGDIYNIDIRNCKMGTKTIPTKNGIRMYSQTYMGCVPVYIRDINITNCYINSDNSPSLYISNSVAGVQNYDVPQLIVRNIKIQGCEFVAPKFQYECQKHPSIIRIGGVNADSIYIDNIKGISNKDSLTTFFDVLGYTTIEQMHISNVKFEGENKYALISLGNQSDSKIFIKQLGIRQKSMTQKYIIDEYGIKKTISAEYYKVTAYGR